MSMLLASTQETLSSSGKPIAMAIGKYMKAFITSLIAIP
jgi:hypothetical protein